MTTAIHNSLQLVATPATHCNTLQHTATVHEASLICHLLGLRGGKGDHVCLHLGLLLLKQKPLLIKQTRTGCLASLRRIC